MMTTAPTQKEIVKLLDRAAGRCPNGATSKQTWFLAGLIAKSRSAELDYEDWLLSGSPLCGIEVSSLIESYLDQSRVAA